MHLADAFIQSESGYTFFISMCVTWELNPQPFALLTQCSTTEPQEHIFSCMWCVCDYAYFYNSNIERRNIRGEVNLSQTELCFAISWRCLTPLGFVGVKLLGLWSLWGKVLPKALSPFARPFGDFQSNCWPSMDADLKVTPECSRAGPSVIGT